MTWAKIYLKLLFFTLAVTFTLFIGDGGKNFLLIGVMALSPIYFFIHKVKRDRVVLAFIAFVFYITVSAFYNLEHFRANSFFYTVFFVVSFLVLRDGIIRGYFEIELLTKKIKWIIYAYFIVLLIQQFCVLAHLPVINQIAFYENPWKLPSLALEPSHLPRFLFFLMYAYLSLRDVVLSKCGGKTEIKKDRLVWISYFWCMLTCGSTTALLFVCLIFLRGGKISFAKVMIAVGGCFVLTAVALLVVDTSLINRAILFVQSLATLSIDKIDAVDHSAAYRIAPFFAYLKNINILDLHFWLGSGLDTGRAFCQRFMFILSNDAAYDKGVNIGGMVAFVVDYGFLFIVFLGYAIYQSVKKCDDKIILLVWLFSSFVESINMQMFWFSLILLVCVGYYTKKYNSVAMQNENVNRVYNEVIEK